MLVIAILMICVSVFIAVVSLMHIIRFDIETKIDKIQKFVIQILYWVRCDGMTGINSFTLDEKTNTYSFFDINGNEKFKIKV